ncbi:hypothetical protein LINPERHAP2_LOCUS14706 [Linum perenne]
MLLTHSVSVLPLLKLGTLVVKTLSKQLAAKLKQQAAYHPMFRQIIIDMAQSGNYTVRDWITGLLFFLNGCSTEVVNLPVAALLLIFLLLLVAGVVVVFEVQRSAKSEARKEAARKQELESHALNVKVWIHTPSNSSTMAEITNARNKEPIDSDGKCKMSVVDAAAAAAALFFFLSSFPSILAVL